MRQTIVASQASFERLGGEIEQEASLDRMEKAAPWTEPCSSKLGKMSRLAWLGVKLGNSFLHRWLNLCEVGAEEVFYALLTPRFFAGAELDPMTAPQETSTLHSGRLLGEHDFLRPANSPALTEVQSKFEISWRTPWLYLVFLLLVWLLLF